MKSTHNNEGTKTAAENNIFRWLIKTPIVLGKYLLQKKFNYGAFRRDSSNQHFSFYVLLCLLCPTLKFFVNPINTRCTNAITKSFNRKVNRDKCKCMFLNVPTALRLSETCVWKTHTHRTVSRAPN